MPFNNWKKAVEKMRAHSHSNGHIQSCETQIAAARAMQEGSIVQQLQQVGEIERLKNRAAIKSLTLLLVIILLIRLISFA